MWDCFGFALILSVIDLKIRSIFLTNQTPNENQTRLGRPRFPAVLEDGLFLLWVFIV